MSMASEFARSHARPGMTAPRTYACEMNFLFVYASSPSMPPSWP